VYPLYDIFDTASCRIEMKDTASCRVHWRQQSDLPKEENFLKITNNSTHSTRSKQRYGKKNNNWKDKLIF